MSMDISSEAQPAASAPAAPAAPEPLIKDGKSRLILFLILMTAAFMAMMDNQIVSTALPTIVGDFGHLERFSWVGSAYLLTSSAVMPLYGKLGDLFGRKYVMIATVVIFSAGSLLCAIAPSMNLLIAARVLQALGGGGIMVTIFSINADIFAPRERAKYQSYSSLVLMMAGAIGPTLGGILTDLFGWRSIFFVNLPIGLFVLVALAYLLPYKRPARKPKIDFLGALLLAGAITSVVLWADSSALFGGLFTLPSLGIIAAGICCGLAWVQVEKRVEEPVVPLSLFKFRTINLLLVVSAVSGCVGIGMINYYALFLQSGLGLSPSLAGLFFIPLTSGIAIGAMTAGRIMHKTGHYKIFSIVSTSTSCIALLLMTRVDMSTAFWLIILIMLMQGIGGGVGQQVPVLGIQNAAPHRDVGAATGTTTLTRIGGASIGISLYGAIVSHGVSTTNIVVEGVKNVEDLTPAQVADLPEKMQHLIGQIYVSASHPLFLAAATLAFIGAIAALCLPNTRLSDHKS